MKIIWTGGTRQVKGIGIAKTDGVYIVDTLTGTNLIKQNLAVLYKRKETVNKQKRGK